MSRFPGWAQWLLFAALLAEVAASLAWGRYPVPVGDAVRIVAAHLGGQLPGSLALEDRVFVLVRLPRICASVLLGASLALAGSTFQTVFRNPLASPSLLGVSAGAGFGAALGLTLHWPWWGVQSLALAGGIFTVSLAMLCNRLIGDRAMISLLLCGLVIAAFFEAMISLVKYFADPMDVLPSITFWQLGSLEKVSLGDVQWAAPVLLLCAAVLYLLRWRGAALALSDEEAYSLGLRVPALRTLMIALATIMVATSVSIAGTIGWVGLLVPHAARMLFGLSPGRIFVATALLGSMFLLAVDDVARSASSVELPLGVLTAMIGAPFFLALLLRGRTSVWS